MVSSPTLRLSRLTSSSRSASSSFGRARSAFWAPKLDSWVRRRLRSVMWKQWKRHQARFRKLTRRGVPGWVAQSVAASSRGPWPITVKVDFVTYFL